MPKKPKREKTIGKLFETIEAASRFLKTLKDKHRYEIKEKFIVRFTLVSTRISYSYLRKTKGKKRRVRVHVSYLVYKRLRRRVRVYYLSLLPKRWVALKPHVSTLLKKYDIQTHDPPRKFLKWFNTENDFWGYNKSFPPYRAAYYVVIEVWFIILNTNTDEFFLWSRSRTEGIAIGVDWNEAIQAINVLRHDLLKWVDSKDYLELVEFVGWSAYPDSNWFNRKRRG